LLTITFHIVASVIIKTTKLHGPVRPIANYWYATSCRYTAISSQSSVR